MEVSSREQLSRMIAQLVPSIIQGVHLGFIAKRALTHSQFFVLIAIHSKGSCSMRELAERMHVTMPTMSGIVDRLVQAKYVARVANPDDRREVFVRLTTEGQSVLAKFQEAVSSRWSEVLQALDPDEVKAMSGIVGKLRASLQSKLKDKDA
jgi:DNA-binding MarR family transcriptional regulator